MSCRAPVRFTGPTGPSGPAGGLGATGGTGGTGPAGAAGPTFAPASYVAYPRGYNPVLPGGTVDWDGTPVRYGATFSALSVDTKTVTFLTAGTYLIVVQLGLNPGISCQMCLQKNGVRLLNLDTVSFITGSSVIRVLTQRTYTLSFAVGDTLSLLNLSTTDAIYFSDFPGQGQLQLLKLD